MAKFSKSIDVLRQGSVVDGVDWGIPNGPLGIVLTNQCDFENAKAAFVIVCCLVGARETIQNSKEYKERFKDIREETISKKKSKPIKDFLEDYIHNKNIARYYFIDADDNMGTPSLMADFQHLISIPYQDTSKLEVVAQLDTPYVEQLMVHFASYSARIPSNRSDSSELISEIISPYHLTE